MQYAVIGGRAEAILNILEKEYEENLALESAVQLSCEGF